MKIISGETIEKVSDLVDNAKESFIEKTIEDFAEQQPYLFAFLIPNAGEEEQEEGDYTEDESELLLYLGIKVWLSFKEQGFEIERVEEDDLIETERKNEQMLDFLGEEDEDEVSSHFANILDNHTQPELMQFIAYSCLDVEYEEELDIDEESRLALFIDLKIFLEAILSKIVK